jgi:bisphosphoglycerate-dependent phosphoglycerate mutase
MRQNHFNLPIPRVRRSSRLRRLYAELSTIVDLLVSILPIPITNPFVFELNANRRLTMNHLYRYP